MTTKLTLTLDRSVIRNTKRYARKNRMSLSKMVEFYFKSITTDFGPAIDKIPPITSELTGIAELHTDKSNKELLVEALTRRHGK